MTTAQARALAADDEDSFLHVTRPEIDLPEGTDEHAEEVYRRGRKNLLAMVERKLLVRDPEPHLYVYSQKMGRHRQTGVVACALVEDYLADRIKKHEKTRPDKEDDRTRHIQTLEAHDEPVFLTYRADAVIDEAVARVCQADPVYDFTSDDGVQHRLWVASRDQSVALGRLFEDRVGDLYVADGHHRSAAAARVHEALQGDGRDHDAFLAVVFPHDQMQILPYNRVVKDPRGRSPEALLEALRARMDVVTCDDPAPDVHGSFGIYTGGRWYRATALPGSFDAADPVARLDCQICQDLVLEPVFGIADPRRPEHRLRGRHSWGGGARAAGRRRRGLPRDLPPRHRDARGDGSERRRPGHAPQEHLVRAQAAERALRAHLLTMTTEIERVGLERAKELLAEGFTYVDVRSVPEYAAGHPAGAVNVPYLHAAAGGMQPNPDFMRVMEAVYPKDRRLLIGCQSGNRSVRAARELLDAGYVAIVELRPGYGGRRNAFGQVEEPGWAASEPTETATPNGDYEAVRQRAGL